jgi:hypothetical protein
VVDAQQRLVREGALVQAPSQPHAFHSPVDDAGGRGTDQTCAVHPSQFAQIPYISNVTGIPITVLKLPMPHTGRGI